MPKPTKLHSKGKSSSLQKPCKVDKNATDAGDHEESLRQFQLELCWCIQQLERSLSEKKGNEKQLQEAWKVLTVLKNNNQPAIRKRQLMRTHFGDYRAKMAAEEKRLAKMASKIKISEEDKPKATFIRKAAFLTTGNEAFKFNFSLTPEQVDNIDKNSSKNAEAESSNNSNNPDIVVTDENAKESTSSKVNIEKSSAGSSKTFKFECSGSDFKFNFDNP